MEEWAQLGRDEVKSRHLGLIRETRVSVAVFLVVQAACSAQPPSLELRTIQARQRLTKSPRGCPRDLGPALGIPKAQVLAIKSALRPITRLVCRLLRALPCPSAIESVQQRNASSSTKSQCAAAHGQFSRFDSFDGRISKPSTLNINHRYMSLKRHAYPHARYLVVL